MGYALANNETYTEILCGECGIVFYVAEHWRHNKELHGTKFYCPNGHCRVYHETIEAKLRKELAEKQRAVDFLTSRASTLDRRLKQEAGKHRALRRRVQVGVCPCCHRTFKQLAAHMKQKHPDYSVAAT